MKFLYSQNSLERSAEISRLIGENSTVLDVCCGPATLWDSLKDKKCHYTGIDMSPAFVKYAKSRSINVIQGKIPTEYFDGSKFDFVVMQDSLYHFIGQSPSIINWMANKAKKNVIISEPIKNLTSSGSGLISKFSKILSDPGDRSSGERFSESSLREFFRPFKDRVRTFQKSDNQRDMIIVLQP